MINDINELIEEINVSVKPISPVFVWSGETLYNNADYKIVNNNKIVIIDIMKLIENSIKLEEGFKEENAREINGFKLIFDYKPEYYNLIRQGILMINEQLVPASSLKGLIRTAFANDLAKDNKDAMLHVKNNLNKANKLPIKYVRNESKKIGEPIEGLFKKNIPLNRNKDYDFFTRLIVTEPKIESFKLNLRKININSIKGNFHKEILAITLDDASLNYNVKILRPKTYGVYNELKELDAKLSKQNIINSLKKFGERLINKELEKIRNSDKFKDYEQFLNNLKTFDSCIPLRIGMFTSHIAKTVEVDNDIERLRSQFLSKVYRRYWDNSTVKTTSINNKIIGVGWIKVCISG